MQSPYVALLVVLVLLLPAGCSEQQDRQPQVPPIRVDVAKVERGDLARRLQVSGPLRFIANTTVSAEVSAQVKSILVSDGQAVHQGQLLLVFDDTKIMETSIHAASTLQKDEATLAFNTTDYEKAVSLSKSGSVSQTALDQKYSAYQSALAQVQMDRAGLAKAMEDLKQTRVKAPITGLMSQRYVEQGDWVEEGGKLFQISDYRKIYLEAHLSDLDLAKLDVKKIRREGVAAEVLVDSYPDKVFNGKLSYVEPVSNSARLFEIRTYLDNPEMVLLQGMFGRGRIEYGRVENILKIPQAALLEALRNEEQNTVVVVDRDNRARLTRVKIGSNNRRYAEVKDGLKEGDLVVTGGKEVLRTGQRVEPRVATQRVSRPLEPTGRGAEQPESDESIAVWKEQYEK
jgi:RND family efflux transporter MFP subunit